MWGSYIVRDMAQVEVGVLYCQRYGPGGVRVLYCQRYGPGRCGFFKLSEIWPRSMWGSYIVRDMAQVDVRILYCQRYGPERCGGVILSEIWPR